MLMLSTQRAERANVPSCRGTCHIDTSVHTPMSKHLLEFFDPSFGTAERRKGRDRRRGDLNTGNSEPQPFRSCLVAGPRVAFGGQQARGVRTRVTPSNLMLIPVDSRDCPRHKTTVAGTFRSNDGGGAAAERLYARFVKLCKVHGARGEEALAPPRRSSRASPDIEGCANDAHDRHVRGAAFAAEMQMVTSLLVGLSWRSSLSRARERVACVRVPQR